MIQLQIGDFASASHQFDLLDKDEKADEDLKISATILKQAFLGDWNEAIGLLQARQERLESEEDPIQRITVSGSVRV
jgi:hypothetical protein